MIVSTFKSQEPISTKIGNSNKSAGASQIPNYGKYFKKKYQKMYWEQMIQNKMIHGWIDFTKIEKMKETYFFFSFKMIWNQLVVTFPKHARLSQNWDIVAVKDKIRKGIDTV